VDRADGAVMDGLTIELLVFVAVTSARGAGGRLSK
jgi:hypothetical protein